MPPNNRMQRTARSAAADAGGVRQSVYSRYAIVDVAMMRESAEKLATLHEADRVATVELRAVTGAVVDISSNKNS